MIAREIIGELGEALGICEQATLLKRINRAVELLSAKDLFDPLIGYLNFNVDQGSLIALPREVRAVIAVNINNNPAFSRSRMYEFLLNTNGTVDGDELEWQWSDRCNVAIQDERRFPGKIAYRCFLSADNGKTCTIEGRDVEGRVITETLTANATLPVQSTNLFYEVMRVFRDATAGECVLTVASQLIAQYYGDETEPSYRSIKLSRGVASVRMMFRRNPLAITTLDSFIPLNSPMAVIQAAKAVGHLMADEDDKADVCLARAEKFIKEDQSSREESDKMMSSQTPGTLGLGLTHSEGISVADVYDPACEIFGPVGRQVIFKKITQAVQVLLAKAHWDGLLGVVDILPRNQREDINSDGRHGSGYYALPRFIGRPLKINICGSPAVPRNRWFEFHLNGTGESQVSGWDTWDELGDTVLSEPLPRGADGLVIPVTVFAVCDNALDEGKAIRLYGREWLGGREVEVWRESVQGWACPCLSALADPGADAPLWTAIEKIEREETRGFVRLWTVAATPVAAILEIDTTTLTTGFALTGVWSGTHQTVRVYGKILSDRVEFYGDSALTILVGTTGAVSLNIASATAITFALNGSSFAGTVRRTSGAATLFTISRAYTAGTAASVRYAGATQLGFWYPDETEPRYALIRLPGTREKRIRVLYRKRYQRVTSLFEPIPLRSSLAVENMLRALKAQELGMVQQAEPLEFKAIQYLSEDRIKEGESEMPTLEFANSTMPGGWDNIQ